MGMTTKLEDHSQEVIRSKDDAIARALEMMGLQAEKYAKMEAPVDTGRLRNSLTHEVAKNEDAVYIGTNVEYAPYVEMGTSRMKARPYLKPAVNEHTDEYKRIADSCLRQVN